jgi:hypothetical protein
MTADAGVPESGQDPQSSAEEASIGDAQTEFQRNRYYVALRSRHRTRFAPANPVRTDLSYVVCIANAI